MFVWSLWTRFPLLSFFLTKAGRLQIFCTFKSPRGFLNGYGIFGVLKSCFALWRFSLDHGWLQWYKFCQDFKRGVCRAQGGRLLCVTVLFCLDFFFAIRWMTGLWGLMSLLGSFTRKIWSFEGFWCCCCLARTGVRNRWLWDRFRGCMPREETGGRSIGFVRCVRIEFAWPRMWGVRGLTLYNRSICAAWVIIVSTGRHVVFVQYICTFLAVWWNGHRCLYLTGCGWTLLTLFLREKSLDKLRTCGVWYSYIHWYISIFHTILIILYHIYYVSIIDR